LHAGGISLVNSLMLNGLVGAVHHRICTWSLGQGRSRFLGGALLLKLLQATNFDPVLVLARNGLA